MDFISSLVSIFGARLQVSRIFLFSRLLQVISVNELKRNGCVTEFSDVEL